MSDDRLQAIKDRLAAATPGPWRYAEDRPLSVVSDDANIAGVATMHDGGQTYDSLVANGHFIAHAPEDIAYLLREVERLRNAYYALDEIIDDLPSRAKYWREVVGHPAVRQ